VTSRRSVSVYNGATPLSIPGHRNPVPKKDSMKLLAKFNLILLVVFDLVRCKRIPIAASSSGLLRPAERARADRYRVAAFDPLPD
jgi:hypothetical protein